MISTTPLTTPPAMPPDRGVCTNLPEACGLAARRQPQPLTDGAGRCSECGSALMLPAAPAAAASPAAARRWLLPVLALLLVLAALAPALVKAFLAREGYTEQSATPTAPEELRIEARRPSDGARLAVALASHGTSTAFASLAAGQAELGMASRPIQAKEREATKALGDLSAEGSEYIVALDGVAVIVHPSNPLKQLTLAQLRDLFTGRTGDWSALGAPAGAVRLHARDEKSGTWDTFRALVLDKQALAAGTTRHEDSRALAAAVAADPMAIGFVGLPYAEAAKTLALADGQGTALRPSRFTVATEDYALARRLYFYVARDAQPLARRLADFAVSDEGQKVAQTVGFIGQAPEADPGTAVAPTDVPAEYRRLTTGAQRLAVNLRFRPGSDQLDNKALRDVGRITRLLERDGAGSRQLMLLGFSDDRGDRCANIGLSQQRARAVAADLSTYGVRPAVVQGYGPAAAVASNDTEAGRERNRRVEVWLLDKPPATPVQPFACGQAALSTR